MIKFESGKCVRDPGPQPGGLAGGPHAVKRPNPGYPRRHLRHHTVPTARLFSAN
jgi:hypothetical protein